MILASVVNLNHPDHYFHWSFILISYANLIVIAIMVALFILALALPFVHARMIRNHQAPQSQPADTAGPSAESDGASGAHEAGFVGSPGEDGTSAAGGASAPTGAPAAGGASAAVEASGAEQVPKSWTVGLRKLGTKLLPPDKLLPDGQPSYVASWIYVFGVLTLGGLACAILSGLVLALEGPTWWHTSDVGHFVNSLHLWSVELFMAFLAIHLWGKFWMAAWRGRRWATWITGMLAFLAAIVEAFTGYLSQTNFDSQWIAFEAKDAFNAGGIGAYFSAMNFGQALMLHIVFIPLVLVLIVAVHITLVRVRGVVHPIEVAPEDVGAAEASGGSERAVVGKAPDPSAMALKEARS